MSLLLLLIACDGTTSASSSEWRDDENTDHPSHYSPQESCKKIIGRINIISRLHKNASGIFEGGMSSRWLEIQEDSAIYFKPSGEVADKGKCDCQNGVLQIDWKLGDNLPEECTIYFRSSDSVELRYYDYPFIFNNLNYDKTKPATNPTKILGTIQ